METPETLKWPEDVFSQAEVTRWLETTVPGGLLSDPPDILRAKSWGVTARFRRKSPGAPDLIFKGTRFPLFEASNAIARLLAERCPRAVAPVLATNEGPGWRHIAFVALQGVSVAKDLSLETLTAMALALSQVQRDVSRLDTAWGDQFPRRLTSEIPALFEQLLDDIDTRYEPLYQKDQGALARKLDLPPNFSERLQCHRPHIQAWAAELDRGLQRPFIDHTDFHTDNAVILTDGRIVILDWEEAVLGHPFFSLDRLLDDVHELEVRLGRAPANLRQGIDRTAGEHAVIEAYLDGFPLESLQRRRHFDLAMALSPVVLAYEATRFATAMKWPDGHPRAVGWHLMRALGRWERLVEMEG